MAFWKSPWVAKGLVGSSWYGVLAFETSRVPAGAMYPENVMPLPSGVRLSPTSDLEEKLVVTSRPNADEISAVRLVLLTTLPVVLLTVSR
jgi:hypothetical protein